MKNFTAPQRLPYTVQPLYKGHPIWWPFKRGGLSWGVKYTWFVENGAWKWTKFCNFSETFLAFPGVPPYVHLPRSVTALQWRHNGSDNVSNHQPHDCLLNRYSDADKKNIKAPRHWPLCGEFTGDQWILCTNGQLRGKCFHMMTSSWPNVSCLHQDWESEVGHSDPILVKFEPNMLGNPLFIYQLSSWIPQAPWTTRWINMGSRDSQNKCLYQCDKTFEQVLSISCKNGWEGEP